ncbi:4-phosphoerythronate dehydrogenase [Chitinispirillales bacterium ANBcel5]|uniref:4-phosphoerythronate dehydrogenase n=1 Tax=Cellulosispirillum alkaliphilum TaxID=3039283 RepID=UPI002A516C49|nr:4-phosphoerythronate dehydrogenase [Chitinispirillales bacterium ANBcel5]
MKIIADQNIIYAKEAFSDLGEVICIPSYSINNEELRDAEVVLVRSVTPVTKELLEGTKVKFVASATIGIDHVDLEYLQQNNIGFAHAPGSNANSVAEYIFSAIFATTGLNYWELSGKKMGIIGVGNVGSRVLRIAKTLGIECLLNDPPKKRLTQSEYYLPLEQVIAEADFTTIHVPLISSGDDSTYHMVNSEFISAARKGSVLINTSRGKVIDEKVLRSMRDHFSNVVLDVWENEPAINTETVRMVDIATPHIAGYSFDGKVTGTEMIQEAAYAFFFAKSSWSVCPEEISCIHDTLDLRQSKDPVVEAIHRAYPISEDDKQFRAILKVKKEQQPSVFEELRKNYPKRYEFTHYKVLVRPDQKEEKCILSDLGFIVEQKKI